MSCTMTASTAMRFKPAEGFLQPRHVSVADNGIDGDIHPPSPISGELADPAQLLAGEVLRRLARGELLQPQVQRIGARLQRVVGGGKAACRGKKLGLLHSLTNPIEMMVRRDSPGGRATFTVSPGLFPIMARARGDTQLTQPRAGSLSSTPTMRHVRSPCPSSLTVTAAPNITRSGGFSPGATTSMMAAMRVRYSILRSTSRETGSGAAPSSASSARSRRAPSGVT